MAKNIQAIRGMHDVLPDNIPLWQRLESEVRNTLAAYGYREIRMPIVEKTELFKRSIGEVTDIVEKEMYTFEDRNGDSLTLRPEGTAGCVRAAMENGLLHNQIQKLWYTGPMFRHERPQKGRYRQFHQIGVETFGLNGPDVDAELILMTRRIWQALGLDAHVALELNTLGVAAERQAHRDELVSYFKQHYDLLDEDSVRRLESNPLRILDSKNPDMQAMLEAAPSLMDHLGDESREHFEGLKAILDAAGIEYRVNPRLVRGLDYYSRTVFEWVTTDLGSQGTVCAGGRYDGLVEQLGGRANPAVGFAMGVERLVLLLEMLETQTEAPVQAYMVLMGDAAQQQGLLLAEQLRNAAPALRLQTHCGGGGFKSQFKKADKSGADVALILGDDEVANNTVGIKLLRDADAEQLTLDQNAAATWLAERFA